MAEQEPAVLKDRSTWLAVFGVAELILGVLAALIIPLMFFSMQVSQRGNVSGAPSMPTRVLFPTISFYGAMAVFWIIMGIGSIKAARWARAISLIASWLWLIGGVIGFLAWLFMIPNMARMMKESGGNISENIIHVMIIFQLVFLLIIFIVIPLIFVLFYGSPSVKATVEREDPKVRWTDKRPLPVLALCLCQVLGALQMASMVGMGIGIPFLGKFLQGLPMVAFTLGISILLLCLAWANYHLKPAGWYGTLLLLIVGCTFSFFTLRNIDMIDLYARMGYQGQQLEMMRKMPMWGPHQMEAWIVIYAFFGLGFLGYIRRYFKPAATGMING